jgi:hypothetical protein
MNISLGFAVYARATRQEMSMARRATDESEIRQRIDELVEAIYTCERWRRSRPITNGEN